MHKKRDSYQKMLRNSLSDSNNPWLRGLIDLGKSTGLVDRYEDSGGRNDRIFSEALSGKEIRPRFSDMLDVPESEPGVARTDMRVRKPPFGADQPGKPPLDGARAVSEGLADPKYSRFRLSESDSTAVERFQGFRAEGGSGNQTWKDVEADSLPKPDFSKMTVGEAFWYGWMHNAGESWRENATEFIDAFTDEEVQKVIEGLVLDVNSTVNHLGHELMWNSTAVKLYVDAVRAITPNVSEEEIRHMFFGILGDSNSRSRSTPYLDEMSKIFVEQYGTEDGFKEYLATDPFGFISDLAMIIPYVGQAAKLAIPAKVLAKMSMFKGMPIVAGILVKTRHGVDIVTDPLLSLVGGAVAEGGTILRRIPDRTFGVELEVGLPEGQVEDLKAYVKTFGMRLVTDTTIFPNGHATLVGREIVTDILSGEEGLVKLRTMMEGLDRFDLSVTNDAGFHVHVGRIDLDEHAHRNIMAAWMAHETDIDSMFPGRRLNNRYARSLLLDRHGDLEGNIRALDASAREGMRGIKKHFGTKYFKLNPIGHRRSGNTIEMRQHEGTLDFDEIANQVGFVLHFVEEFKDINLPANIGHRTLYQTLLDKREGRLPESVDHRGVLSHDVEGGGIMEQGRLEDYFDDVGLHGLSDLLDARDIENLRDYVGTSGMLGLEAFMVQYPDLEDRLRPLVDYLVGHNDGAEALISYLDRRHGGARGSGERRGMERPSTRVIGDYILETNRGWGPIEEIDVREMRDYLQEHGFAGIRGAIDRNELGRGDVVSTSSFADFLQGQGFGPQELSDYIDEAWGGGSRGLDSPTDQRGLRHEISGSVQMGDAFNMISPDDVLGLRRQIQEHGFLGFDNYLREQGLDEFRPFNFELQQELVDNINQHVDYIDENLPRLVVNLVTPTEIISNYFDVANHNQYSSGFVARSDMRRLRDYALEHQGFDGVNSEYFYRNRGIDAFVDFLENQGFGAQEISDYMDVRYGG